jgi:hypothetical protein
VCIHNVETGRPRSIEFFGPVEQSVSVIKTVRTWIDISCIVSIFVRIDGADNRLKALLNGYFVASEKPVFGEQSSSVALLFEFLENSVTRLEPVVDGYFVLVSFQASKEADVRRKRPVGWSSGLRIGD